MYSTIHGEPFTPLHSFPIVNEDGEKDVMHRIRFNKSGNEIVVSDKQLASRKFRDVIIAVDEIQEVKAVPVEIKNNDFKSVKFKNNKTGKTIEVNSEEDMNAFVKSYKLDSEAIQAVVEGKQKTHKKWSLEM